MSDHSALFQEIYAAIFNPSSLQGEQGERTTTEWQAAAVISALQKFYPHIEQVYAGHLQRISTSFRTYQSVDDLHRLAELVGEESNLSSIDTADLSNTLEELASQTGRELAHRDALLDTAIMVQGAVIQLLNSNDVFIGTHWVKDINNESRLGQPALLAHVWSYGADTEEIPAEKLLFVADLIRRFGPHAIQAWVCHVRGWSKPIKGELDINGLTALNYLNSLSMQTKAHAPDTDDDVIDDDDNEVEDETIEQQDSE